MAGKRKYDPPTEIPAPPETVGRCKGCGSRSIRRVRLRDYALIFYEASECRRCGSWWAHYAPCNPQQESAYIPNQPKKKGPHV